MQRMVENLLHLARADAGQLRCRCERINPTELLRHCWAEYASGAERRGLKIEWDLPDVGSVNTDPEMLALLLGNILENAVNYANPDSTVHLSIRADNGELLVRVGNQCAGASDATAEHAFDRFWRGSTGQPPNSEREHCGLGLSLCKSLAERLGGSITARCSAPGEFTITVRLPQLDDNSPPPKAPRADQRENSMSA